MLSISLAGGNLLLGGATEARAATAPALLVGQGLDDVTAELAWMAVSGASAYKVYRDGVLLAQQTGTRFDDGSLIAHSGHRYAVSAVVGGTESPLTPEIHVTTQAARDTTPPTTPNALNVLDITPTSAEIDWAASLDDVGICGYRIYRGPAGAADNELTYIATTDVRTSYAATNLYSDTDYKFGVAALDAADNLSPIQTVTFRTALLSDSNPPLPPTNGSVAAVAFSSSRIDVRWGSSTSSDVAGYQVYRDGVLIGAVDLPFRKTLSDTGLASSHSYTYTIRTVDSAGNVSAPTGGRVGTTLATGTVRISRGPYLQWVTPTSARIAWWTNELTPSVVQYGLGALDQQVLDGTLRNQHMMLIGGLNPESQYQYRVGDGTTFSANFTFSTAARRGSAFSFAVVGDFGGGSPNETNIANQIAASGTQFVQTVGDNVYPDASDPDFLNFYSDFDSRFYRPYAAVIRQQAIWFANGNKEYYGDGATFKNFWMPNNERWYSYQWGDGLFLVLDSQQPFSPGSPQYQFARGILSRQRPRDKPIVFIHYPPYSSATLNSSSEQVQQDLVPLFERYGVKLVLSGNTHNYERSYPLLFGEPATGGITYIVTGGGGNGLNTFTLPQPAWSAFRNETDYEYVRVTVTRESIQVDAITDTGTLFDSTTIR